MSGVGSLRQATEKEPGVFLFVRRTPRRENLSPAFRAEAYEPLSNKGKFNPG